MLSGKWVSKPIIEWESPKYIQRTDSEHTGLTGLLGLFSIMRYSCITYVIIKHKQKVFKKETLRLKRASRLTY